MGPAGPCKLGQTHHESLVIFGRRGLVEEDTIDLEFAVPADENAHVPLHLGDRTLAVAAAVHVA